MGSLSLERVQYKFASIIGELCSEPDVLSQFAVWLDLRLAEYKLKGNISLDCSGEEPDPIWLKGLKKGHNTPLPRKQSNSANENENSFTHNVTGEDNQQFFLGETSNSELINRLSPDVTVINDDEQSKIYPVACHENELQGSKRRRKVSLTGESSNNWTPSPAKHKRLSNADDSPSNQSLMSVLSVYQGNMQESDAKGDNLSAIKLESSAHFLKSEASTSHFTEDDRVNYQQGDCNDLPEEKVGISPLTDGHVPEALTSKTPYRSEQAHQDFWSSPRSSSMTSIRRQSIANLENLSRQSVTNMVAAAGTFERWLGETYQDTRQILQVAPKELDTLLVHFFLNVKRSGGGDYTLLSLQTLRSHLDRYLRECNYPESLMKSEAFTQSRKAFQSRRQHLSQLKVQEALAALNNSPETLGNVANIQPDFLTSGSSNNTNTQSFFSTNVSNNQSNMMNNSPDTESEIYNKATISESDLLNSTSRMQSAKVADAPHSYTDA